MENHDFLHEFSQKESQNERDALAQQIKEKRREARDVRQSMDQRTERIEEHQARLDNLKQKLEDIGDSTLKKITHYFKIKSLAKEAELHTESLEHLKEHQSADDESLSTLENLKLKIKIDEFYKRQKEKWRQSPYSKKDIEKYFNEAYLEALSLPEYELLLTRFPGEMLAHVTRQGLRDHTGHMFHNAGLDNFSDSFMKILDDGRLRSPLGVYMMEDDKKLAMRKFLQLEKLDTKEAALEYLETVAHNQGGQGSYADRAAIHFAAQEVADCYYGSERGNEIFIVYPSALIASQYNFAGNLKDSGGGYWNDQWVWTHEENGIDIDSGVVFIPKNAHVDPKNGSRYELDDNKQPQVNSEYISIISDLLHDESFVLMAREILEITGKRYGGGPIPLHRYMFPGLETFVDTLQEKFKVPHRLLPMIFDYQVLSKCIYTLERELKARAEGKTLDEIESVEFAVKQGLREAAQFFKEAEQTISSEDYWENYFKNHPEQKPSKIVYYEGQDPTNALRDWKSRNNIRDRSEKKDLEFSENATSSDSEIANNGLDRFTSLALQVIDDYYAEFAKSI